MFVNWHFKQNACREKCYVFTFLVVLHKKEVKKDKWVCIKNISFFMLAFEFCGIKYAPLFRSSFKFLPSTLTLNRFYNVRFVFFSQPF